MHITSIFNSFTAHLDRFNDVDAFIQEHRHSSFVQLNMWKRFELIHQQTYQWINASADEVFLLPALLDFFEVINREQFLNMHINCVSFEFWLNHFAGLNEQENYRVRAKIVGKNIPRHTYQAIFPIGANRVYNGSHIVAAHLSPDIDTTVASFWGWIDAFGARLSTSLHKWSLPGGPPNTPLTSMFAELIHTSVFDLCSSTLPTLTLTTKDLFTRKNVRIATGSMQSDYVNFDDNYTAWIVVDEQGFYQGEWRHTDHLAVQQVVNLFHNCMQTFQNDLNLQLARFLVKEDANDSNKAYAFIVALFEQSFQKSSALQAYNDYQIDQLHNFLCEILMISKGLNATFGEFIIGNNLSEYQTLASDLSKAIQILHDKISQLCAFTTRIDIALKIKHKVLNLPQINATLNSNLDEIRHKIDQYDFLTVVMQNDDDDHFIPLGIIRMSALQEHKLGTVSLRDFCNLEEVHMPSCFQVISVIDHHRTSLKTISTPTMLIADVQSCNVLLAEQVFILNDKYSQGGMHRDEINQQIEFTSSDLTTSSNIRILQKLLQRRLISQQTSPYYIHPKREFAEYLSLLYAIFDDTDLFAKVSERDVNCVVQLLNRLKSLASRREVEMLNLDHIPQNQTFARTAAKYILQHPEVFAIYKQIYTLREMETAQQLQACLQGEESNFFMDTKEQNGCTRVGQTKIFRSNFECFLHNEKFFRHLWYSKSTAVCHHRSHIDLHIHMISTIASANEMYMDQIGPYTHQDELWIWIPFNLQSKQHLQSFLKNFSAGCKSISRTFSFEFTGSAATNYLDIFQHAFADTPHLVTESSSDESMVIIRFQAGALNSRKSMITPFLPTI